MERQFYKLEELAELFGMTLNGVRTCIARERFPVPTYRIGKIRVADKKVVHRFFEEKSNEGMIELEKSA
tara:strand:- start:161 stop:367 length:207 start_codon:yes stop_codon:yes gene_type:complete